MTSHSMSGHTAVLSTLDPDDPVLDDLDSLRGVVSDARVVGVGEGAYFVREFTLARAGDTSARDHFGASS
ncbi:hypothetical protein ACIBQ1_12290 [Nonomuraea sp. NPDC050153]|uniref:hypothetical protein n=1 Tax=Nonomuraea sp. NPDC050153 TaxID=3364359 RepID=UPI00378DB443